MQTWLLIFMGLSATVVISLLIIVVFHRAHAKNAHQNPLLPLTHSQAQLPTKKPRKNRVFSSRQLSHLSKIETSV